MRGKGSHQSSLITSLWITPAHAGKSMCKESDKPVAEDHPRPCGEKSHLAVAGRYRAGSPPPMRGKATINGEPWFVAGITPAHAGKSYFHGHYFYRR